MTTNLLFNHRRTVTAALTLGVSLALALPAFGQDSAADTDRGVNNASAMSTSKTDETPAQDSRDPAAGLTMTDQAVAGSELLVRSADLPESGWLVVHYRDKAGELSGDPIGTLHLSAGRYENITVGLNAPVKAGETLVAMLHTDGPGDDETYGETADHAVMQTADGEPVRAEFKITEPANEQAQPVAADSGEVGNRN